MINLPANLGIGGAVQTGYKYARLKDMILLYKLMLMGSMTLHFLGKWRIQLSMNMQIWL